MRKLRGSGNRRAMWLGRGSPRAGSKSNTINTNPPAASSSVEILLHMDGSAGGTTFTDSGTPARVWTRNAGGTPPTTETVQKLYGTASGRFQGGVGANVASYISTPTDAGLNFGAGDFTIELSVYKTENTNVGLFSAPNASNFTPWLVYSANATGILTWYFSTNGSAWTHTTTGGALSLNTWAQIAASRVGPTIYLFKDGVVQNTLNIGTDALFTPPATMYIGCHVAGSTNNLGGYIDEVRFTKGLGRYSANYTPTGPF